jgi:hypothetical protein
MALIVPWQAGHEDGVALMNRWQRRKNAIRPTCGVSANLLA